MRFFYSAGIQLFIAILHIASFFNSKIKEGIHGRKNWKSKVQALSKNKKIIWFHCASLGEFDQGLPVMNQLKKNNPDCFLVVTFFSPSGMQHCHKRQHSVDEFLYLPFDTVSNARFFLEQLNPAIAVFVKYEFWPNFIHETAKRKIPLVSISTLLREKQIYFHWYGTFFAKTLQKFTLFCVQNERTQELLKSIGIESIQVVGDTRFDRVAENKQLFLAKLNTSSACDFAVFEQFLKGEKAIILGSSWPQEENILKEALVLLGNQKIIIAPHSISESHIRDLESIFAGKAIRFTQFKDFKGEQILFLDTIGHLASAYYFGKMAFVGGGFSGSLHNILEPAIFGLPICFGPKHAKFPEATDFLQRGFAKEIRNASDLITFVKEIDSMNKQTILDFMTEAQGATFKCVHEIEKIVRVKLQ